MTAEQALARLHAKIDEAPTAAKLARYLTTVLAILGTTEPAVLEYVLDRADERAEAGL